MYRQAEMTYPNNRWYLALNLPIAVLIWVFLADISAAAELDTRESVDAAINASSELIKSSPGDAENYLQRGNNYFKLNEFDLAIKDFTAAIDLNKKMDAAYYGRGLAYGRRGLIDEGIADLSVFLQRNPENSLAYTKRGVRYLWKRELENAERDLSRAIELNKDNAEAHDDLGVVFSLMNEYGKAITHFFAAVRIEPDYQKAYHNLAMAFYTIGKDKWALDSIDEALKLKSDARDSIMLKGNILKSLGREKEAVTLIEDAEFLPEGNWTERVAVLGVKVDADLIFEGINEMPHRLDEYIGNGKWTILNIWGPRCPPCIEEMPQLQAFHDDHSETDAIVVGLAIDFPSFAYARINEVKEFIDLNDISYPMLLGDAETVSQLSSGKLSGVPTTLIYSPDGEFVGSQVGQITADEIENFIRGE